MLTIFPLSQDNMLGFTLDGEIDEAGMSRFLTAVEAKILTHGKLRLLGNIRNLGGWDSFQTFWKTMKAKKELWDKIEKYAILCDNSLITAATNSLDWVAPNMVIKTFKLSEGEIAHKWLGEPLPTREAKAIKFIDLGHTNILGLAVVGKMEPIDYEKFDYYLEDHARQYGKVKLFLEVVELDGISLRAIWEDLKTVAKHYKSLERVAFVGDQAWLKGSAKFSDLITPGLDIAAFGSTERQRAINWLL
ncbi:MAG: STAS/SEC14 domain-containing protein [Bacteroidota bacterium]